MADRLRTNLRNLQDYGITLEWPEDVSLDEMQLRLEVTVKKWEQWERRLELEHECDIFWNSMKNTSVSNVGTEAIVKSLNELSTFTDDKEYHNWKQHRIQHAEKIVNNRIKALTVAIYDKLTYRSNGAFYYFYNESYIPPLVDNDI